MISHNTWGAMISATGDTWSFQLVTTDGWAIRNDWSTQCIYHKVGVLPRCQMAALHCELIPLRRTSDIYHHSHRSDCSRRQLSGIWLVEVECYVCSMFVTYDTFHLTHSTFCYPDRARRQSRELKPPMEADIVSILMVRLRMKLL